MRPVMPNGKHMGEGGQPNCSAESTTEDGRTIGKMIDRCLALTLTESEIDILNAGSAALRTNEQSLNQSLGYIHQCPLFLSACPKGLLPDVLTCVTSIYLPLKSWAGRTLRSLRFPSLYADLCIGKEIVLVTALQGLLAQLARLSYYEKLFLYSAPVAIPSSASGQRYDLPTISST